jgi:Protein of unknown function (DUF2541)
MKKLKVLLIIPIVALFSFTIADRGWKVIGDKVADYRPDRDVLIVSGNDVFTKLKIKISNAPLNMFDMDVVFENGEKQNFNLQQNFRQGEWSRVLDLNGNKRRIEKIIFKYDTKNVGKGKAKVVVYGRR